MATLFVMCGLPAAGKSTFIKEKIKNSDIVIVSRDEIRFSFVKKRQDYFTFEKQVKRIFWERITSALQDGKDVIADQTSLTIGSRKSLLKQISGYDDAVLIWIDTDFHTCFERNKKREGLVRVPNETLKSMNASFETPTLDEGFSRILRYNIINGKEYVWAQAKGFAYLV